MGFSSGSVVTIINVWDDNNNRIIIIANLRTLLNIHVNEHMQECDKIEVNISMLIVLTC